MVKGFFATAFLAIIGLIALLLVEQGLDFALGVLFGAGGYQLAFYLNKGQFIE